MRAFLLTGLSGKETVDLEIDTPEAEKLIAAKATIIKATDLEEVFDALEPLAK